MIKKRNLDNSLVQWIMTVTGLGPGLGEFFWVAPTDSATSQFKAELLDMLGVGTQIYATPTAAEAAMVAYRNDVMLIAPGNYVQTAEIDWDKAYSHIVGLAGPNTGGDYGDEVGVNLYTTTASVAQLLDISGKGSRIINIGVDNNGANAANVAAVKLDAVGLFIKGCTFFGNMNDTQGASANCASVIVKADAMYPLIEDCVIGSDCWGTRSGSNSGQILFNEAGQPNNGVFRNCIIRSLSVTAATCMVAINPYNAIGRGWVFDNCGFLNSAQSGGGQGTQLNQVFYWASNDAGIEIILHNCYASGADEWQDTDAGKIMADMPIVGLGGGLVREPTAVSGN